jgi:hypothetical protein
MEKKKPKWGKPKLIVLIRGKPEEGLLYSCKMAVVGSGDQASINRGCRGRTVDCTSDCLGTAIS